MKCIDGKIEYTDTNGDIVFCGDPISDCVEYVLEGGVLKCSGCVIGSYPAANGLSCVVVMPDVD